MMPRRDRELTIACVGDQSMTAAALHESLTALFPGATILRVDTAVERDIPPAVECAVIDAAVNGAAGIDVLRVLRAGGYAGAAVLVLDANRQSAPSDELSAERLGARRCVLDGSVLTPLAAAVADALRAQDDGSDGTASTAAARALRQTQRLIAAGELAMRLQHSLNNPLAGLLAEAQLLELESLPQDHRESVERIIELTRRVIDVVRGLDGVGRA
jgi:signal transduction histidine kinase